MFSPPSSTRSVGGRQPFDGSPPVSSAFGASGAAGAIAASIGARLLAFVTDVPGVRGQDGRIVRTLDRERALALIADGTIEGGMLPKVEACLLAAASGCEAAILATRDADAVERLLAGERIGTVFPAETPVVSP